MTSYETALRKGVKWYRKLVINLILGCGVVNALVIYKEATGKKIKIKEFWENICIGLLGIEETPEQPGPNKPPSTSWVKL